MNCSGRVRPQGGVVHSNSWGDDTTAYTERTGRFDAYARAMPWSAAFIAPGNGGEGVLEPANGRNVIAISATTKSLSDGRWGSSAYGPTDSRYGRDFHARAGGEHSICSSRWILGHQQRQPSLIVGHQHGHTPRRRRGRHRSATLRRRLVNARPCTDGLGFGRRSAPRLER